jgi:hypothetical protein
LSEGISRKRRWVRGSSTDWFVDNGPRWDTDFSDGKHDNPGSLAVAKGVQGLGQGAVRSHACLSDTVIGVI